MSCDYYCYDNPAALKSQLDDYFDNPSNFETLFSLLYTSSSVPNIILPFVGGYFVDKYGFRVCIVAFSCFVFVGQLVFAVGISARSWNLMYLGRVIYAIGGRKLYSIYI